MFWISGGLFWASASVLRLRSSNLFMKSSRSDSFSESSSPPMLVPLTSHLAFDWYLFMRVVAWSLRLRAVAAHFWHLSIFCFWLFFPYLQIYFQKNACSPFLSYECLFLISWHDRPKEGKKRKINLQVV